LCLLLLFGIVYAEQSDQTSSSLLQTSGLSELTPASLTAEAQTQNIFTESVSNSAPSSLQPMFNNTLVRPVSFSYSAP